MEQGKSDFAPCVEQVGDLNAFHMGSLIVPSCFHFQLERKSDELGFEHIPEMECE